MNREYCDFAAKQIDSDKEGRAFPKTVPGAQPLRKRVPLPTRADALASEIGETQLVAECCNPLLIFAKRRRDLRTAGIENPQTLPTLPRRFLVRAREAALRHAWPRHSLWQQPRPWLLLP